VDNGKASSLLSFPVPLMSKGVLLVNLGSPDSPSVPDVRRYLREFLMDGRVLDVNWLVRFCIVNFAILPSRPKQSAHAYQSIWTEAGSPLVVTNRNVQAKLQQKLSLPIELAMRYQNPSIPRHSKAARPRMHRRSVDPSLPALCHVELRNSC
jgi:protoheme ferro-lyase